MTANNFALNAIVQQKELTRNTDQARNFADLVQDQNGNFGGDLARSAGANYV